MPYNVYILYSSLYIILICRKMCSTYLGHPFFNPHASLPKQQNKMVSECGYKTLKGADECPIWDKPYSITRKFNKCCGSATC